MGFRCPKCKKDFGGDRIAFNKHLKEENISNNLMDLTIFNLLDLVKNNDCFDHVK